MSRPMVGDGSACISGCDVCVHGAVISGGRCPGNRCVRRCLLCARACCHGPCCPAGALLMWSTSMWRSSWPSIRVSYGQILRSCRKGVQQRPLSCKSSASNGRGAQRFMKHFATTQVQAHVRHGSAMPRIETIMQRLAAMQPPFATWSS